VVGVESDFPEATITALKAMGYTISKRGRFGRMDGIQISKDENSKNQKAFVRPIQNLNQKANIDSAIDNQVIHHIVKSKETVFSIAKKYGVSPSQLDKWNQLDDKPIQIGQKLVIYIE
jgi:LysM repeat protein